MQTLDELRAVIDAATPDGWRYDIQYGPNGEDYYAWVYLGDEMIATMKTHHAISVVQSLRSLPSTVAELIQRVEKAERERDASTEDCRRANELINASIDDFNREKVRAEAAEARVKVLEEALSAEEQRNEALLKRMDAERTGYTIAHCYDPADWEYTYSWDDRDEVHNHGDSLTIGQPMLVFTLLRGPRKWVAEVPITRDENGDPDETEIRWFDSEEDAHAALQSTGEK